MKPTKTKKGLLLVISGPSGSGKSTVISKLIENDSNIFFSVSATTRKPRMGEVEGKNYYFISPDEFKKQVNSGEMLEWAEYCGNCYGTPKDKILEKLEKGSHVLLEIEVQGALQVRNRIHDAVLIFIMPPTYDTLHSRLVNRNTETKSTVESRLHAAVDEISKAGSYDYIVISDQIENTVAQINAIITSEQLKAQHCKEFIQEVVNDALSFHQ